MTVSLKHKFVSAIPDGTDATIVRPSNWNDEHAITGTANKLFGFDNTGAASEVTVGSGLTYSGGTLIATGDGTGTVTSINVSGDSTGLTFTGGPVTTSGTITMGGTLAVAYGGTGATTASTARTNLGAAASGANSDITSISGLTGAISSPTYIQMGNGASTTLAAGRMWYNQSDGSWNMGMGNGNITQQVGEELFRYGKASAAITDSPLQLVYKTGTVGASGVITFAPAVAGITDSDQIIGCATENISTNGFGRVTTYGIIHSINTTGSAYGETWSDNTDLYYNPVTGGLTKNIPVAPGIKVLIGTVINAGSGGSGSFIVKLGSSTSLARLSDAEVTSPANGNLLIYSSSLGYWKNSTLTAGTNVSITNGSGSITINATDQYTGTVTSVAALTLGTTGTDLSSSVANSTTTPVITLNVPTASATNRGALSAADWTTFNNKGNGTVTSVTGTAPVVSSGGATPAISMAAATGSVNGYLTSTDWTTFNNKGNGTVTSVAALTLGTTGTDVSSSVATGTTTPVITLNLPTASSTNRGLLSSADWTTFNNKGSGTVTSVTGTAPVVSSGGTTPAISMAAATTSVNGYLTSADWTTFNGKQAALVSGTNIKTVSGTSLLGSGDVGTIGVAYGGTGQTTYTDGQLLIGNSTGNTLAKATLTAGTGITITNGSGTITIAASSSGITQAKATALSMIFGL
jgi:hypothetical protein